MASDKVQVSKHEMLREHIKLVRDLKTDLRKHNPKLLKSQLREQGGELSEMKRKHYGQA